MTKLEHILPLVLVAGWAALAVGPMVVTIVIIVLATPLTFALIGAHLYRVDRPHRLMRWAVAERRRFGPTHRAVWLAARKGRRAFQRLYVTLTDWMTPAMETAHLRILELGEQLGHLEPVGEPDDGSAMWALSRPPMTCGRCGGERHVVKEDCPVPRRR